MIKNSRKLAPFLVFATFMLGFSACAGKSPEQQALETRRGYSAQLNTWLKAESNDPAKTAITFDLLITNSGDQALPGLTFDLSHADSAGKEKRNWRHFVELPKLGRGQAHQASFTEQVEGFVEGDLFSVDLLKNIPIEKRGEYRELQGSN